MTSGLHWEPARSATMAAGTDGPESRPRADSTPRTTETLTLAERTGTAPLDLGPTTDDRTIVDAVLAGDRHAFRLLVEREGPAVVAACARILGDRAEAEDVAQEAFVIAYRSLSTWRADGAFGAWLSRIAVRLAIRRARARKQVTWLDPLAAEADPAGTGSSSIAAITRSANPADGFAAERPTVASSSRAIRDSAATSSGRTPGTPSSSCGPNGAGRGVRRSSVIGRTPRARDGDAPGPGGGGS